MPVAVNLEAGSNESIGVLESLLNCNDEALYTSIQHLVKYKWNKDNYLVKRGAYVYLFYTSLVDIKLFTPNNLILNQLIVSIIIMLAMVELLQICASGLKSYMLEFKNLFDTFGFICIIIFLIP